MIDTTKETAYIYDDGGREAAGFIGTTRDCVTRAIAIATGIPYREVYDLVNGHAKRNGKYGTGRNKTNARTGVLKKDTREIMDGLGFEWMPTMEIGRGCETHLRADELPGGIIVAKLSRHVCAVIDGTIHDIFDPSRDGTRCVYGYWILRGAA